MLGALARRLGLVPFLLVGTIAGGTEVELRLIDEAGQPTSAQLSVVDDQGRSHVAKNALPVGGQCMDGPQIVAGLRDPSSGARVFFVEGFAPLSLSPGRYRITASKGPEYREATRSLEVTADGLPFGPIELRLERWIDMPKAGWFGADGHLHIPRDAPTDNGVLSTWMRAAGLHVAGLLQMGRAGEVVAAKQYAFGAAGTHLEDGTLLAPAQENPRTWLLGHGIVYGADQYLDPGAEYFVYQPVWKRAHEMGGVVGYAHAEAAGLWVDAPRSDLDLLEVLQGGIGDYAALYRLWNLGFLVAPVAGTDFPCLPDLPGSDRFYTQIEGPLSYAGWVDGIRAGRTFVTNGPMLALEVEGHGIGETIELAESRRVRVSGSVRFDPTRDDVQALELIQNGKVVARLTERDEAGRISLLAEVRVRDAGWIALRAVGKKLGPRSENGKDRGSEAHTGPIAFQVEGAPPLGAGQRGRYAASQVLRTITRLQFTFSEANAPSLKKAPSWVHGVSPANLTKSLPGLADEFSAAEAWYRSQASLAIPPTLRGVPARGATGVPEP